MKAQQNQKTLKNIRPKFSEQIYEFANCEALTSALIILFKNKKYKNLQSSLYILSGKYRMIIKNPIINDNIIIIKEFYNYCTNSIIEIAITKEYGKSLIQENAISVFGKAFIPMT